MNFSGLFAGLTTIDIQYFVDEFPASNEKIKTYAPEILVGGPATNAAVAFAFLNGGASLVSATGKNSFSIFIKNDFKENNIHHYNLTGSVNCNPVLATVVTSKSNGNRTIFTHHPGPIASEIASKEIFRQINPQIILLDGFHPESFLELARNSRKENVPVVLDCGSWKPQYIELLPLTDIAICSEDFIPPDCKTLNDVFDFLNDNGVKKSAISRGGDHVIFNDCGKREEMPVEQTAIADSLGAGDFLHGAFCYYYLQMNHHFEHALKYAVKFATLTCKYKGTRSWIKKIKVS
jgi:sugar/nucleoside kinase (ribokinase family)